MARPGPCPGQARIMNRSFSVYLDVVRFMSDQMIVMKQGEIVERGAAADIYANPQHPYTQELLGAIPKGWTPERAAALA